MMTKYVYDFSEGNKDMKDLLGGKGANLAEMTNMGLPVPPGFTATTEACLAYLDNGDFPPGFTDEVEEHLRALEETMSKRLGDTDDPLLVSVRSGAKFSMPGMMDTVLEIYREHTGAEFPKDPREQMKLAIEAVFRSWNGRRAIDYRRQNKISDDLGTAVNVVAMVFGNRGMDSGTGVAFTRDPSTGQKKPYGDYLPNAQGEDVVAGIRNTLPLAQLEEIDPASYRGLMDVMSTLEGHYRDMCDIEFTIEKGKLWILQTRVGKRTAFAEWVMAADMVDEGLISLDEALLRVDANRLEELFKRVISSETKAEPIASGLNASPGAASGKVVFTAD